MHIDSYIQPKSSFLSIDKDMNILVDKIMKNRRLQKLLYYSSRDALDREPLNDEQIYSLFGKHIKLVPKLYIDGSVLTYIIISFDNFIESENPEFRDNIIEFDIICHFDQWQLQDFELRPYRIAAELDSMLNKQRLTGIGELEFLGANQIILTDEYAGLCLMYRTYHGGEDKKPMPNPDKQSQFEKDYKEMFEP